MKEPSRSIPLFDGSPFVDPDKRRSIADCVGKDPTSIKRTSVIAYGQTVRDIEGLLVSAGHGIERVKLFSDYAALRPDLPEVQQLCASHGVDFYVGGGVLENRTQKESLRVVEHMQSMGIDTVEVSNGDGELSMKEFEKLTAKVRGMVGTVLVEIGRKTRGDQDPDVWSDEMKMALDNGADRIVLEGSGSGLSGIYDQDGQAKTAFAALLLHRHAAAREKLVVEAPHRQQQVHWMTCGGLGWDARFGNVAADREVLDLLDDRVEQMGVKERETAQKNKKEWETLSASIEAARKKERHSIDVVLNTLGNVCLCRPGTGKIIKERIEELAGGEPRSGSIFGGFFGGSRIIRF